MIKEQQQFGVSSLDIIDNTLKATAQHASWRDATIEIQDEYPAATISQRLRDTWYSDTFKSLRGITERQYYSQIFTIGWEFNCNETEIEATIALSRAFRNSGYQSDGNR
jgi:hypothetical protein